MPGPTRARLTTAARYLLAALLLTWILGRMDLELFLRACAQTAPWVVPFAVVTYYLLTALQAVRWWLTQRPFAPGLSCRASIASHFLAGTYSVALPSSVAQDVVRTTMVSKQVGYGPGWGAAWVNRIVGLLAWLVLCLVGLGLNDRTLAPAVAARAVATSLLVLAALVSLSFSKAVTRPVRALASRVLPRKAVAVIETVRQAVYVYRSRPAVLLGSAGLALGVELCFVLCSAATVYGISGTFPLVPFLLLFPLIEIVVIALPLTPGGLGLREGLTVTALARLGLTPEETGLYAALSLLGLALKALGGVPFLLWNRWRVTPGDAPPSRGEPGETD
ncbi:MAG: lysylphosphatidylglycerol synthase transmembrane domain-containing protein [Candidatus Latescibacterota bacterium]|jgi:hypothetical protein